MDPETQKEFREQRVEKALLLRESLTQEQTAALLGVSRQAVAKWESTSNATGSNASDRRRKLTDADVEAVLTRLTG
ncbi:MAG: helix-turn-helix domain-containing protein [Halobacteriota archaeon]